MMIYENSPERIGGVQPTSEEVESRHSKITAMQFVEAFRDAWKATCPRLMDRYAQDYEKSKHWTAHMIKGDKSFFGRVAGILCKDRPSLSYRSKEIYTIDALITDDSDLLGRLDQGYPTRIYAAIEHENGDHPEEEMWKLIWWRCPLKVIVFYDWNLDYLERNPDKKDWLPDKLKMLSEIKKCANQFFSLDPENLSDDSEYLIIVGNRRRPKHETSWRYVLLDNHNCDTSLKYLAGPDL